LASGLAKTPFCKNAGHVTAIGGGGMDVATWVQRAADDFGSSCEGLGGRRRYHKGWTFLKNDYSEDTNATPTQRLVAELCTAVIQEAPSPNHLRIRLKGLQASFLLFGFNLQIKEAQAELYRIGFCQLAELADRLRFLCSPRLALTNLRLEDIDEQHYTVKLPDRTIAMPAVVFPLVNVLRLDRLKQGASPDDLLFVDNAGKKATRLFTHYCNRATKFTGVIYPQTQLSQFPSFPFASDSFSRTVAISSVRQR